MNIAVQPSSLPSLVDRAARVLQEARTSAEILEARDMASVAYDAAKKSARIMKMRGAHDQLVAAAHRAQADALEIEAQAKRRLADEYDAAQERGEVAKIGDNLPSVPDKNSKATAADIGLSRKEIHEARIVRDAEKEEPGIIRRALDQMLESGEPPERAKINRIAKAKSKRTRGPRFEAPRESQHDRDVRMLMGAWEAACDSAREEFISRVS